MRDREPWQSRVAVDLLAALLLSSVVHRLSLGALMSKALAQGATTAGVAWLAPWRLAWADLLVAALAALLVRGLAAAGRRWLALAGASLLLLVVGGVRISHLGVLSALRTGLSYRVLADALSSGEGVAVAAEAPTGALLAGLWPLALFAGLRLIGRRLPDAGRWCALVAALGLSATSLAPGTRLVEGFPAEAPWPPVGFTVVDVVQHTLRPVEAGTEDDPSADDEPADAPAKPPPPAKPEGESGEASAEAPTPTRQTKGPAALPTPAEVSAAMAGAGRGLARVGLRIVDPRVTDPQPTALAAPLPGKRPTNVVWIIMESTGTRYATGETFPQRPPMPFLSQLAGQGWYLARHRSNSNSSATSIVAQLSGLLPRPSMRMMSVRRDNHLPGLPGFLPGWDRFLVTPGKLSYFFPRSFFLHTGMQELWGFAELPFKTIRAEDRLAKDEIATVGFFLERLRRAREPFFGVYYSYMPHWEYTDYGKDWRRYRGPRLIDHYHNGLWLLDHQIRRIVDALRANGQLERTLIVLVGDHGEAFGQHKRNWAHAKGSYEENLQTPAILWYPPLLKPRRFDWPTTHIDLMPTVLDLLGVGYQPRLVQGESLLQQRLRRKVSLHWGNEGTVTAIHRDGTKVQLSLVERWCRAFDLVKDPRERRPRRCNTPLRKELRAVLRAWVRTQRPLLDAYSRAAASQRAFEGWRHPGPVRRATPQGSTGAGLVGP